MHDPDEYANLDDGDPWQQQQELEQQEAEENKIRRDSTLKRTENSSPTDPKAIVPDSGDPF